MAHVKRGVTKHARHRKILKLAKGYRGRGSTNYRIAMEKVERPYVTPIATGAIRSAISAACGFSASTPACVCTA